MSQTIDLNIVPGGSSVSMNVAAGGRTLNLSPEELRVIEAVSPTVEAEGTEDGVQITVHDLHGTETVNLHDGAPGRDGSDGQDGSNGATFTPSVSAEGVISWTNDGGLPNPASVDIKGDTGADGVSPAVSVSSITGGHRVTITDADHPAGQAFDVLDGQDGQDGATGPAGPGVPDVTAADNGKILRVVNGTWAAASLPSASGVSF